MQLSKLKWKCRKGIRELDVLLTKYLEEIFINLPKQEQDIFIEFVNIDSNELFDIVFNKKISDSKFLKIIKNLTSVGQAKNNEQRN
tara:strand:+ start:202 stop:459 length:258 start_codon:yes stop_codon:yes gene_type:complete